MKIFIGKCLVLFLLLWSGMALAADSDKFIFLSSTIGPIDSGIVGALEDQFEKETGIRIRYHDVCKMGDVPRKRPADHPGFQQG